MRALLMFLICGSLALAADGTGAPIGAVDEQAVKAHHAKIAKERKAEADLWAKYDHLKGGERRAAALAVLKEAERINVEEMQPLWKEYEATKGDRLANEDVKKRIEALKARGKALGKELEVLSQPHPDDMLTDKASGKKARAGGGDSDSKGKSAQPGR